MPDLGASLRDLIDRSASPVDVDGIVRTRRRRRGRRRGAAGVAVAVVVALVAVGLATRSTTPKHEIAVGGKNSTSEADATRSSLAQLTILSPGGGTPADDGSSSGPPPLHLTDPVSGTTREVAFPVPGLQTWTYPYVAQGSNFVMLVKQAPPSGLFGGHAVAQSAAFVASSTLGQWRFVQPATAVFASLDADRVWLVNNGVVEVALDGMTAQSGPYPLTLGRSPIAALADGLLTTRPDGSGSALLIYEVWDPKTGRAIRQLDIKGPPLAVSASRIAWIAGNCAPPTRCGLHLTDVRTGTDRVVAPPAGLQWSGASFSPDGTQLALVASPPPSRADNERDSLTVPPGDRTLKFVIVDAQTLQATARTTTTWKGALNPSWSPDGSLVFFTRDQTHVGYFAAISFNSPVRVLTVPDADRYLILAKPAPPAPPVAHQRYSYDGQVVADRLHSAELCIYPTTLALGPFSDSCSGPLVAGWDPNTPNGRWHLVGTYDGNMFTLTQPPSDAYSGTRPRPAPRTFAAGCAPPPGGWHVVDASKLTFDTYTAVTNAARAAPDFAGIWMGPYLDTPGVVDAKLAVINFAFTGNLAEHRRALAAIYGGPICAVRHRYRYDDLQRIVHELVGPIGAKLGLQMLEAGPDDLRGVVHAEAIAVTPAIRRALDARYGAGVIDITSVLQPVP